MSLKESLADDRTLALFSFLRCCEDLVVVSEKIKVLSYFFDNRDIINDCRCSGGVESDGNIYPKLIRKKNVSTF